MNRVAVTAAERRYARFIRPIQKSVARALSSLKKNNCWVDIYLVNRRLNFPKKNFGGRKRQHEFNVLALPAPKNFPRPDTAKTVLGEIYINPDYVSRQGESILFMAVHGLLHLLGYDHKKKSDRIKMARKEKKLLKSLSY